jgi:hypothetical protein
VPHAVGTFVKNAHTNIRIAQPPMRTPKIDLKQHGHRNFQRDPKRKWLRELVASLFTDEPDEWRAAVANVGRDEDYARVKDACKTTRLPR